MNVNYVYSDAEEKYVKTAIFYGKSGDSYLYLDSASATAATEANRVDKATLLNALTKGALISYGGAFYTPVSFKDNGTSVEAVIATVINAASTASVTLYSKEYTAD